MNQGKYSITIKFIHLIGDLILINLCFLVGYRLKFGSVDRFFHQIFINPDTTKKTFEGILTLGNNKYGLDYHYLILLLFFNIGWILATWIMRSYEIYRITKNENTVINLLKLFGVHILLVAGFIVFQKAYYYSREHLLFTYLFVIFLITAYRLTILFALRKYRKKGFNYRRTVIVGLGEISQEIKFSLENEPGYGYKLLGFFDDRRNEDFITGKVSEVIPFCKENDINEIFCSVPDLTTDQIQQLVEFADNNLIRIKILPDVRGFLHKKLKIDFFEHIPVLLFRNIKLDEFHNKLIKRAFDILFSLTVILLIGSWLFPILAIIVKISSKGPVFFKQKRSGINNQEFWCYKFRSMAVNQDADTLQASRNDARVTKIGAFMRKTSLDELPQFFNVLYGSMSVVGPRPHMLKHTEEYSKAIDKYMVRHFIKPGITGLAQVKGYRGETRESAQMKGRIKFDVMYIENWSFVLDLKIIMLTVLNAIKREENAF